MEVNLEVDSNKKQIMIFDTGPKVEQAVDIALGVLKAYQVSIVVGIAALEMVREHVRNKSLKDKSRGDVDAE